MSDTYADGLDAGIETTVALVRDADAALSALTGTLGVES